MDRQINRIDRQTERQTDIKVGKKLLHVFLGKSYIWLAEQYFIKTGMQTNNSKCYYTCSSCVILAILSSACICIGFGPLLLSLVIYFSILKIEVFKLMFCKHFVFMQITAYCRFLFLSSVEKVWNTWVQQQKLLLLSPIFDFSSVSKITLLM